VTVGHRAPVASGEKLRRLQTVTDSALSTMELDDLLVELLERTKDLLAADTATILLLDPAGTELVATAAVGLEEEVRQGVRIPVGRGFAGRIAASAGPVTLDRVDRDTVVNSILIDRHLAAMAGVPMLATGRVIGVLHVGSLTPRRFGDDDVDLLRLVADRASLAVQAHLSRLERATTLALQRSLLPVRPPTVAGFDVATRYIPGAQVGVGGDWYDVFTLPSGHVGVTIGDVAGNGLRAATVMGRIRSALRAYALETNDPADVLTRLDRKIQLFEPDAMATAIYAVIEPPGTTVTLSVAGHPPPVRITPQRSTELLTVSTDFPLGAYLDTHRRSSRVELPPGSGLLFYTDGLVERRGHPVSEGIQALLAVLANGTAEDLCTAATALLPAQATDDVAILAMLRNGPARPTPPADPAR
jgi:putative methionine-R-sulfoxide reductase with GAF domain